jgi:hypothetical protein
MKKSKSTLSTFEKEMTNPKFRKLFQSEFSELLESERELSIAEGDEAATERLECLAKIEIGLKQVEQGKTTSAEEAFERIRTKLKFR